MQLPDQLTPMMKQWRECKERSDGALLLFRMGDFYEAFYEDARQLSKLLGLTLTARGGNEMAGVPVVSLTSTLDKLSRLGQRVAIAEQIEDPKRAKGLVKREIVRIVSPGTAFRSDGDDSVATYVATVHRIGTCYALALADIFTGELFALEFDDTESLRAALARYRPKELVFSHRFTSTYQSLRTSFEGQEEFTHVLPDWKFDLAHCCEVTSAHFGMHNLDGFGLKGATSILCALGGLLQYLRDDLHQPTEQFKRVHVLTAQDGLSIDRATLAHLDLLSAGKDAPSPATLLEVLNETLTPMGGRLLRKWVVAPLKCATEISARQTCVRAFLENSTHCAAIRAALEIVRDLDRLATKLSLECAGPRDLMALCTSLRQIPQIIEKLPIAPLLSTLSQKLHPLEEAAEQIERNLVSEPALKVGEGAIFRAGIDSELDALRSALSDDKAWLSRYQEQLRESLGLKSLKVGYTPAFGYYIEVSKAQCTRMPPSFQRRQTLVNNERFLSPELKSYEDKIYHADEKIAQIESARFDQLRRHLKKDCPALFENAAILAQIDCLASFAHSAARGNYHCPRVDHSQVLSIQAGRHPIVEKHLPAGTFIPNDAHLDFDKRMTILTGPNMGGKSTYIRQIALLVILAQMGSFVPAKSMHLGVVDKIFTRIGASDDLARGQSTFMVEMAETANILNNATSQSLVILDEIGRGTSTHDGIAIARAIAEYLITKAGKNPRVYFATHYWELTDLARDYRQVENQHVAVHEEADDIKFLYKIAPGSAQKSFGIHVARLAGIPLEVLASARILLAKLESKRPLSNVRRRSAPPATKVHRSQLDLFPSSREAKFVEHLCTLDLDNITPLQALQILKKCQMVAQSPNDKNAI